MPEKTLLQKAQELKSKRGSFGATPQEIELALAWAKGEITISQVAHAIDMKGTGAAAYCIVAKALATYIRDKGL